MEHLISREAPHGVILLGVARADVLSPHNFLEILSGLGLDYGSEEPTATP